MELDKRTESGPFIDLNVRERPMQAGLDEEDVHHLL